MALIGYVAKRCLVGIGTLVGVIILVFLLTHILPGNPALVMCGMNCFPETLARLERFMGLDKPLPVQFQNYVTGLLRGDMGMSYTSGQPVLEDLLRRVPASLELASVSFFLACVLGIPLGILAAIRKGSWLDKLAQGVVIFGASMPLFWLGLVLVLIFNYRLHWAPAPTGRLDIGVQRLPSVTGLFWVDSILSQRWDAFRSAVSHLILPAATLAAVCIGPLTRMTRASMLEILDQAFIQTARAVGLAERKIVIQDALKNAVIPVVTMMGMTLSWLLAGNIIVEMMFAWPGIGSYAWTATSRNDFNAIQGFVLFIAVVYVSLNLVIDLIYAFIDPRVRLA